MTPPAITATLVISSINLGDAILEKLSTKSEFTTVTENDPSDIQSVGLAILCIRSNEDTWSALPISHIGIVRKNHKVATSQVRVKVTEIFELPKISIDQLTSQVPKRFKSKANNCFVSGYASVPPRTGQELYKALLSIFPQFRLKLDSLYTRIKNSNKIFSGSRDGDRAAEKDAVGICLDIFGIDRSEVFRKWDASEQSLGSSFLTGLREYVVYEDDIISHDLHSLPGWTEVSKDISGIVEFENPDGARLTIINANRKPKEKAFGVDLIYFHRNYEAFTLVQYKMMDQKDKISEEIYFNPQNKSNLDELDRMRHLSKLLLDIPFADPMKLHDYRLANCPIFFKLCKKLEMNTKNTSISPGAYLSLNQFDLLLNDVSTKGPQGGRQIGYHTLKKRYIGTQTFVDLVQKGFLGTQGGGSHKIALFIESAVERGHSVLYAIENGKQEKL